MIVAQSCLLSATYGLRSARLLCPWSSPGKITGVGCHFLLQGILPTQASCIAGESLPSEPPKEATCNSHSNSADHLYLIQENTRARAPCVVPMVVFLIRIPSLPGLFQCRLNLGRRWSTWPLGLGTEEPVPPLPLPAQGGRVVTGCWWWRRLRDSGTCIL